ncbi:hypothetical protein HBJ16_002494, partial [Pseudomonas sp. CES]
MRFVVIPAVPTEKETFPRRLGFPSALGEGYDLYDTHDKIRRNRLANSPLSTQTSSDK